MSYNKDIRPFHISIIGGGFSGVMTAIHLIKNANFPIQINIINAKNPLAKGVAYNPHTKSLLLNVPNGKMSAFSDHPNHFLEWLRAKKNISSEDKSIETSFSTREEYGNYLSELWNEALSHKNNNVEVNIYNDFAYDITERGQHFFIKLKSGAEIASDFIVLATGNGLPRTPAIILSQIEIEDHYHRNPWQKSSIDNVNVSDDILIIGNGLTMVDTLIALIQNGFKGNIHTISPNGNKLNPWKESKERYLDLDIIDLFNEKITLLEILIQLNKHRKQAKKLNQSFYEVIDGLRPHLQRTWHTISLNEKRQFMKHLRPIWNSVRHRLPTDMYETVNRLYKTQRLYTYKGFITKIVKNEDKVNVTIATHNDTKTIPVQRIINCTGPDGNVKLSDNELLKNLEKKGLISPAVLDMGINAHHEKLNIIDSNGNHKPNLYTLGTTLKGILWESTAVPELRVQSKNIAMSIIETCNQLSDFNAGNDPTRQKADGYS